jgi:hypothetical protein
LPVIGWFSLDALQQRLRQIVIVIIVPLTTRRLIAKRRLSVMAKPEDCLASGIVADETQDVMSGGFIEHGPIQDLSQRNNRGDPERIAPIEVMSASGVAQHQCMYQPRVPHQIIDSVLSDLRPQTAIVIQQLGQLDERSLADAVSVALLRVGLDFCDSFVQIIPKASGC